MDKIDVERTWRVVDLVTKAIKGADGFSPDSSNYEYTIEFGITQSPDTEDLFLAKGTK